MWLARTRTARLEQRVTELENRVNCMRGIHRWIVRGYLNPEVICEHCYKISEQPKTEAVK